MSMADKQRQKHIQEMNELAKKIHSLKDTPHRRDLIREWNYKRRDLNEYDRLRKQ